MCVECLANQNAAMGDKGIAIKDDPRYDGDQGQDKKFEGMAPGKTDSAKTVENTGRQ